MYIEYSYLVYMTISIAVTIWVAKTLHSRGQIFLIDAFHGNRELAESVNHLLVVGFYLINAGYVMYALRSGADVRNLREAIELLSDKLGLVLLVLGGMHFFNLLVVSRFRKRAMERVEFPVMAHEVTVPPRER